MRILLATAATLTAATLLGGCAQPTNSGTGATTAGGTAGTGGDTTTTTGGGGSGGATTGGGGSGGTTTTTTTSSTTTTTTTTTINNCGNGTKDDGEQCDGADFGGKTCASIGFSGGQLQCNNFCAIVASGCTPPENCNNAQDDDQDGQYDCLDADCSGQPVCLDSCASPIVATLPSFNTGDNTGRPAIQSSSCSAASGSELVFQLTAPETVDMTVIVYSFGGADFTISVRTACGDQATELVCVNDVGPGDFNAEQFKIPIVLGQTYFVVVDGTTANDFGFFEIDFDIPQPEFDFQCDDHSDNDFDGYLDCDDATECQVSSYCQPGVQVPGSQCFASTDCAATGSDPICLGPSEGFADGYCSEFCDLAAPVCAGDGICADPVAITGKAISVHPVCFDACVSIADCRPGYDCVDRGLAQNVCIVAPENLCDDLQDNDIDALIDCQDPDCQIDAVCSGGAKATGQPCVSTGECFSNMSDPVCLTDAFFGLPGGYCSQFCNIGADDCGVGAVCSQGFIPLDAPVCLDVCNSQADCRVNYSCIDIGLPKKVCVF